MGNSESMASSKNMHGMAGFDDIQKELTVVLTMLFDIMYPVAVFFGGIALAASTYRSIQYGWHGTLSLQVGMYLVAVVLLVIRGTCRSFSSSLSCLGSSSRKWFILSTTEAWPVPE